MKKTTKKTTKTTKKAIKKADPYVLVRTYSAGVHVGTLASAKGERVVLRDASLVWRWRGANTLHELSLRGPDRTQHTRISERVAEITLTEAIEIIPIAADRLTFDPVWLP